jgi:uncharacterized repeat protein (TIGR01451 family)
MRQRHAKWHKAVFAAAVAVPFAASFSLSAAAAMAQTTVTVHPTATPSPTATGNPATPASGHKRRPLALTISVTDGRHSVRVGDLVRYTIKIRDIGQAGVRGLRIVDTLPSGMKLISATGHYASHASKLTWPVNLPAGRTSTFRFTGRVGPTPKQLLRLATIACASRKGSVAPLVCAAHSDELPAGAVAAAARTGQSPPGSPASHSGAFSFGVVALLLTLAAAATSWLVLRRRTRA